MRILQVDNWQWNRYGNIRIGTGRKLFNGFVRNGHKVLEFSDRDIAKYEAPLRLKPLGERNANKRLVETCLNYEPDFILLGHADLISNKTLLQIRKNLPNIKIAYRNVDALFKENTIKNINRRAEVVDGIFITSGGAELKKFLSSSNTVSFMPNPCDPSFEDLQNDQRTDQKYELTFCGAEKIRTPRVELVQKLKNSLTDINFGVFGILGTDPLWGPQYDNLLFESKASLNLNRVEGHHLYSSARISQLMANGILTYLHASCGYQKFFQNNEAVFFESETDLLKKIRFFSNDDQARQDTAKRGREFYQQEFSAMKVSQFIIEATFDIPYSFDYCWQQELFRQ